MSGPLKQRNGYIQKREDVKRAEWERQRHQDNMLIARALNRVADQLVTDEKEEEGRDSRKATREIITILLVLATVIAAGIGDLFFYGQMSEMQKAYEPAQQAAAAATRQSQNSDRALIASTRAWIGPSGATFDAAPSIGKDIEAIVSYQNTGRQPAQNLIYEATPFIGTIEEDQRGAIISRILFDTALCFSKQSRTDAGMAYPTTGFTSYTLTTKIAKELIDQDVVDGKSSIFLEGCFAYSTFEQTRHSAFCFFYKSGNTKPGSLNFCPNGNRAD